MKKLHVWIEIAGVQTYVGSIIGNSPQDGVYEKISVNKILL